MSITLPAPFASLPCWRSLCSLELCADPHRSPKVEGNKHQDHGKCQLSKADLAEFTGTEQWYRHSVAKNILYTDGIKYMAEKAGAYWLIDEIAFQKTNPSVKNEEF